MTGKEDKKEESTSGSNREQGNISLQCPKLTESNYTQWAILMKTILKAYCLWEAIDSTEKCPKLTESNYTQWAILMETILKAFCLWEAIDSTEKVDEKKAHTMKAMIFQTLPGDILMQVAQYENAKEVWDAIEVLYLGADLVQKARLQTLRSELETLKMKENETISDFSGRLGSIRARFKNLGSTLKDKTIVRKLLNSVPKKFLPIVATIEQYSEIDTMPFEEAVGRITAYEERIKSTDEPEEYDPSKLLLASTNNSGNSHGRGRGKGTGHGRSAGSNDQNNTMPSSYIRESKNRKQGDWMNP
ncbi:zinc finger, CCHC-type [Artemisia annua]|uniref:Zinc finger, CCHC-type n=1 Tax=Artemisia annua TaxID=35608 RepID=A0A2U1M921_ARTAN|nr:zinc finger, CCHC-type [Artemisia annua]